MNYKERYTKLFTKATEFLDATGGAGGYDIYQVSLASFSAIDPSPITQSSCGMEHECRDTIARSQHYCFAR